MDWLTFQLNMKDICTLYGGSVISGQRSTAHNESVGGSPYSLHPVDLAKDVRFDTLRGLQMAIVRAQQMGIAWKMNAALVVHFQALTPIPKGAPENVVT